MTKLKRKAVLLNKIEATYGVDATPTGALNAIEIMDPSITPLAGGTTQRGLVKPDLGADAQQHVGSHVQVSFGVALAGAGAAGDVPAFGSLLRACAMTETVSAGVDVVYAPTSDDPESATQYFYQDGTLHKLLGARGNMTLSFPPNDFPRMNFSFTGLWADPTEAANPTADFSAFINPLTMSNSNTGTFSLHGYAGVLESLSLDLGNQVTHRDRPGAETVLRTDRKGTGQVAFVAPAVTTKNFFTTAKANTLDALQIIHGPTAGNIVQIDCPKAQILEPTYDESDGLLTISANLSLVPDAGDDEFTLTIK